MPKNSKNMDKCGNMVFPVIDPAEVKEIVLNHLNKFQHEIMDKKHNTFKHIDLPLEDKTAGTVIVQVGGEAHGGEDDEAKKSHRDQVKSLVQNLVNEVQSDGDRILVVNVNTPAIDLEKNFDEDQLNYMKEDIYQKIEGQLGVTFPDDVQQQWDNAFKTMMDIVKTQKQKHS